MEISNFFLNTMRAKGLTFQKLADRLGMTRQNVHKSLNSRKNKSWRDVEITRWCAALGVDENAVRRLWQR